MGRPARILPIERVRELVSTGQSRAAIAKALGCDIRTLDKAMAADGIKTRWKAIRDAAQAANLERQAVEYVAPSRSAIEWATPFGTGL